MALYWQCLQIYSGKTISMADKLAEFTWISFVYRLERVVNII